MARKAPAADTEHMEALIAETAYYKAEQRGFAPGYEVDDWLVAEREVRTMLADSSKTPTKPDSRKAVPKGKVTDIKSAAVGRKKKS